MLMQRTFNLDHNDEVTLTLNIPFHGGTFYFGDVTLQGSYSRQQTDNWYGHSFDLKDWGAMFMSNNTFIISRKPHFGLELNGYYLRPARTGLIEGFQRWGINAAAVCGLFDNKLVIRFDAKYLLEHVTPGHVRFDSQYMDIDSDFYGRSFTLSLSYRFKGYTDRSRREVDTSRFGFQ